MFGKIKEIIFGFGAMIASAMAIFFAFKNQQKEEELEEKENQLKKETARADSFESKSKVAINIAENERKLKESQEKLQKDISKKTSQVLKEKEEIVENIATKPDNTEYKVEL